MGWWSSLWNGVKAVAEVATKAVTTVARATAKAVTTVARATAKAVTTVARATAKAVTTVARATVEVLTPVVQAVGKANYKLATTPPIQTLGAILYVGAVVTGFALGVLASAIVPGVLLDRLREFLQPVPSEPGPYPTTHYSTISTTTTPCPPVEPREYAVPTPNGTYPPPTLRDFLVELSGHNANSYDFCPEPFGREPCLNISTSNSKALMNASQGLFCSSRVNTYCVTARNITGRDMIGHLVLALRQRFEDPWHLCQADFTRCSLLGDRRSREAITGLLEPISYDDKHPRFLNVTMSWQTHPEWINGTRHAITKPTKKPTPKPIIYKQEGVKPIGQYCQCWAIFKYSPSPHYFCDYVGLGVCYKEKWRINKRSVITRNVSLPYSLKTRINNDWVKNKLAKIKTVDEFSTNMNCRCKKGWDFDDSYALWHTCKKGYPRCFSAGSTRSQPPLIGLITLGKDRRKIITALRLTTTRYDLLESTEGSNKFAIRRKAKRIDAENEYPMNMTCECQKSLGASLFYYDVWYHCKEGHLRCIPMNLNQSRSPITVEPVGDGPMSDWPMTEGPITTLNPETKYQRDKETQTVSTRFYWLQRFTAMLPNFLALPALIMGIWLVIIRCRKLQQHKSWLKAQFVCIVANFTGLLWICVFIICDYHTNRILMILNCLMLLSLIIMCLSSIVSFIIVMKNYKKTQEVPTEQQRE